MNRKEGVCKERGWVVRRTRCKEAGFLGGLGVKKVECK